MKKPDYYTRCYPGKRPRFATFDFETAGLGGPIVAISYAREGDLEPGYICEGDMLQELLDIMMESWEFTWFAHNAQYEFRYFTEGLIEHSEQVSFYLRTNSDMFMITIQLPDYGDKARLVMRDSMALWDGSLASFTDNFCKDIPKLELDFERETFDPSNEYHIRYAKTDSWSLLYCLARFNQLYRETFDINIRSTIAGTALAAWQRTLEKDEKYYNSKAHEDFIRSAYYGGLVFITDTNKIEGAKTYDINSSYPYQMMTHVVPKGNPARTRLFDKQRLGIYRVIVKAPADLVVPILPKRDKKGIVWPAGTFETTVTSAELKFAVANGYTITEIIDGRVWFETCKPFDDFIHKCRSIRLANPGTALDKVAKLTQNSLYGKFGSRRERKRLYAELSNEEAIGSEPWGDFWIKTEVAKDMQCLPQWAVFITAYARLHLLQSVYMAGPANCLYGDTDSITVRPRIDLPTGFDYGDWKLDKRWDTFRAKGPKIYAGTVEGELKGAAKGIPRRVWSSQGVLASIYAGDTDRVVSYKRLEKYMQTLRTGHLGQRDATRSLSSLGNSRTWEPREDGTVRPRTWEEIEARESRRK